MADSTDDKLKKLRAQEKEAEDKYELWLTKNAYPKMEKLVSEASESNMYAPIVNYLASRGALPQFRVSNLIPSNANAAYSYDPLDPNLSNAQLKLSPYTVATGNRSSLLHELTHAADQALNSQYYQSKKLGLDNQFTQAYEKMVSGPAAGRTQLNTGESPMAQLAKKIAPNWYKEEEKSGYRTSPTELMAHGVGRSAYPEETGYPAPPHIDPTIATQTAILIDLAQKHLPELQKAVKKAKGGKISMPDSYRSGGRTSLI